MPKKELLESLWSEYNEYDYFNKDILPEELLKKGTVMEFAAGSTIIAAGDFPKYVYFFVSGEAQGIRQYIDGNNYNYFTLDERNGAVGLLELFSRSMETIATIVAITDVIVIRMSSGEIYKFIMNDVELLRRCLHTVAFELYLSSGNNGLLYYKRGLDRVKYFLIEYYKKNNIQKNTVVLESDFQSIAHSIGISSRTVGRSMKQLREAHLVGRHKKKFSINYEQYRQLQAGFQI